MHVNPAYESKINWTQVITAIIMMLAASNPELVPLVDAVNNHEVQTSVVALIAGVGQVATFVFRTWFTVK